MSKVNIEFKCENCGNLQPKNEKNSDKNWNVFDISQKCDCGGLYKMFVDGICIGDKPND